MGIDLIAKTENHLYWAIQCKYRDNEQEQITWSELSTFAGLAFSNRNISYALLCATTEKITKVIDRIDNFGVRTIEVWRNLDEGFFAKIRVLLKNKPIKIIPYKPRHHQTRAIKNAIEHFIEENNHRGKLIMPCGTGKSLTAYWIADKLKSKKTIITVPSLSLMSQTIDVWLRENLAIKKNVNWIAVCSDETVAESEKDEIALFVQDLGIPVETDVNKIIGWLKRNNRKNIVVFTTYQSGKVIAVASSKAKMKYDFGIFDEAHKTVGRKDKLFSHLLFDENIQIKKRLFMTATERRYAGSKSDKIISMEKLDIYGETFELLSFKEALEYDPPILCDFRVVTMVVEEAEIEELINENIFVTSDKLNIDKVLEAEMLASAIALRKSFHQYPINHAISFHRSIKRSKIFQLIQNSISEAISHFSDLETFHIDGKMTSGKRDRILNDFIFSSPSLISNARCLTEGIDVKKVDCVLFADPKRSRIDIVQAIGRALRPLEDKRYGYIIVPIIFKDGNIEPTAFDETLFILRALAANDERIVEYFRAKFNNQRPADQMIEIDVDEKLALKIDVDQFIKSVETKCWRSVAKLSWRTFEEAREFAQLLNLKKKKEWDKYCKSGKKPEDIPFAPDITYKSKGWISWGGIGLVLVSLHIKNANIFHLRKLEILHKN